MPYGRIALGILAYFASSFLIQGMLAFAVAGEYFNSISIFRPHPMLWLSMPATIVTAAAISALYHFTNFQGTPLIQGLKYGILTGLIVTPVVAMDIPGRFDIPFVEKWLSVQATLGMIHSTLAGILISLINRKRV